MTTPSGQISFLDLMIEFGNPGGGNNDLGSFRVAQTVGEMNNLPLDEGIPGPGSSISFDQLRNKKLNIVISYSSSTNRPPSGRNKWNNNTDLTVIGGGKQRSDSGGEHYISSSSGTSVTLHVSGNTQIGNQQGTSTTQDSRYSSALRTGGTWNTDTELEINIGGEAQVCGGGGNGGDGSESPNNDPGPGEDGNHGNSAIGIAYPVSKITVESGGIIAAGSGGGAGGGAGKEDSETEGRRASGGGGGGGAGLPAGEGGGSYQHETETEDSSPGDFGQDGTLINGGNGGNGGKEGSGEASGGGGGGGGCFSAELYERIGTPGTGGERGHPKGSEEEGFESEPGLSGNTIDEGIGGNGGKGGRGESDGEHSSGGFGGFNGFAVVRRQGISAPPITNNGLIIGSTNIETEATDTPL